MDTFINFIESLSDQELLSVLKYRNQELNPTQKEQTDHLIKERKISIELYEQMTKDIKNQKEKVLCCPRCYSTKLFSENVEEKFPDFQSVMLSWRYGVFGLAVGYECIVCTYKFDKKLGLGYIFDLLRKY